MKHLSLILLLVFSSAPAFARFSLSRGTDSIEFTGAISAYYNYRFYDASETDLKKNRFVLKDAQFKIQGLTYEIFEYELQLDFAGFQLDRIGSDDLDSMIMDAFVEIDLPVDVTVGYQKVPYSFSSLCASVNSPFIDRGEFVDSAFYRRDLGIKLSKSFWKQRIRIDAGIFNGNGKILKNGDESGNPEYAARLSVAFPARYRYDEIDFKLSPIPLFVVGANVRYTEKGEDIVNDDDDLFPLMIDGTKLMYGFDAEFSYMGFSLQAEWHQIKGTSENGTNSVFFPVEAESFLVGAFQLQANYYFDAIDTILAVRYDEVNPSTLVAGNTRRSLSYSLNYLLDDEFNAAIKLNYFQHLAYPNTELKWKEDELRLLFQLLI